MTVSLNLVVNDTPISTDYFVQGFIDHTVSGVIEALEGTGKIKDLNLAIDGEKVSVTLNGKAVPTNVFASKIIKSTIFGMVAPLKGVSNPKKVTIVLKK
ncbi:MAG: hypothetical protein HYX80_04500 [Chloroflexi bacterium]|nr:hypothetical protein [Chloroflexota bacterium]